MESTSPHYTPVQVLQAGRRAEAGGRPDYAIQFYRHLVTHHPASPEGLEARGSLDRLTDFSRSEARPTPFPNFQKAPTPPAPIGERRAGLPSEGLARLSYAKESVDSGAPLASVPISEDKAARLFNMGRFCAHVLAVLGIGCLLAALIVPVAVLTTPNLGAWLWQKSGWLLVAPGAAVFGLVLIVLSQLALTVFQQSALLRDMTSANRGKKSS